MTPPPTDRARALANMLDQLHANACGKHHAKVYKDVCAVVEKLLRDTEAEVREQERVRTTGIVLRYTGKTNPHLAEKLIDAIREAKP